MGRVLEFGDAIMIKSSTENIGHIRDSVRGSALNAT